MSERPMLICYDGSVGSVHSLAAAATLFGGRKAVVVHVGPFVTTAEGYLGMSPGVNVTEFESLNLEAANERAAAGAALAQEAGLDAQARGELADETWQGIADVADEIDAAVIVIGSRGLHGFKESLEGSVSHQLATHAGRPVLVVPPAHH